MLPISTLPRPGSLLCRACRQIRDGADKVRNNLTTELGLVPSTDKISSDETLNNLERQLLADTEERLLGELAGNDRGVTDLAGQEALWEEVRARITEIVHDEYSDINNDIKPLITEYFFQRRQTNFLPLDREKAQRLYHSAQG